MRGALERLVEVFQTQPWIVKLKFIKTATIPIIKLMVDTSYPCLDPSYGAIFDSLNRPHCGGPIEADISV